MKSGTAIIILTISIFLSCMDTSTISGYVYDFDSGKPINGAIINFCFSSEAPCLGGADSDVTNGKGYYYVETKEDLLLGSLNSITVAKDGYITFSDNFDGMQDYELSIYLKKE